MAPAKVSVLVTLPASQISHERDPVLLAYLPGGHKEQACVEEKVYEPALHFWHLEAPPKASVLVTLPGGHDEQAIVELLVKVPGLQGVQTLAPTTASVSVTYPPKHGRQEVLPEEGL